MPKSTTTRVRIPVVKRVARRHGHLVVHHAGTDYVLVPLEEIERREDEEDIRDALRAEALLKRGRLKTIPYDQVRRDMGLR